MSDLEDSKNIMTAAPQDPKDSEDIATAVLQETKASEDVATTVMQNLRDIWLEDIFMVIHQHYSRSTEPTQQEQMRELANRLFSYLLDCPDIASRLDSPDIASRRSYLHHCMHVNNLMLRPNQLLQLDFSTISVFHYDTTWLLKQIYSVARVMKIDSDTYCRLLLKFRDEVPDFLGGALTPSNNVPGFPGGVDAFGFFSYVSAREPAESDKNGLLFYIDYLYSECKHISKQEIKRMSRWLTDCCLRITFTEVEATDPPVDISTIGHLADTAHVSFSTFQSIAKTFAKYGIIPDLRRSRACLAVAKNPAELEAITDLFLAIIPRAKQPDFVYRVLRRIYSEINTDMANRYAYTDLFYRLKQKGVVTCSYYVIQLLLFPWNTLIDIIGMCKYLIAGTNINSRSLRKYALILRRYRQFCTRTGLQLSPTLGSFQHTGEHILHGLNNCFRKSVRSPTGSRSYTVHGLYHDPTVKHFVRCMTIFLAPIPIDTQMKIMARAYDVCKSLIAVV